jgi:hypothetical protein
MNGVGLGVTENVSREPVGLGALFGVVEVRKLGLGELTGASSAEQATTTLPKRANSGRISHFMALVSTPWSGFGLRLNRARIYPCGLPAQVAVDGNNRC